MDIEFVGKLRTDDIELFTKILLRSGFNNVSGIVARWIGYGYVFQILTREGEVIKLFLDDYTMFVGHDSPNYNLSKVYDLWITFLSKKFPKYSSRLEAKAKSYNTCM